jgi:sorbitol/mannitol transport system substrate-binding protein
VKPLRFATSISAALVLLAGPVQAETTLSIATVNNTDMAIMQELSTQFEEQHPDIKLDWQVFSENELRQYLAKSYLQEIARGAGKGSSETPPPGVEEFDIVTIGTYDVPIWSKWGWLTPLESLPESYDLDDVLQSVRDGLSDAGTLYALPFYGESSMTFYRTDLFEKAGLSMPDQPTWDDIKQFAEALTDKDAGIYGICLRGKPGWGENMALLSTMVHTFGGQWFDENWNPTLDTPEWKEAVTTYVDLLNNYGPPGASSNGFNENLALFASGKCAIWIDATVAAGLVFNPAESQVADKVGFAQAPIGKTPKGNHWLWSWALAIPASSDAKEAAEKFIVWATSKPYIELVGEQVGWASVPPGTRISTYVNPQYAEAAPFAKPVLEAIQSADPTDQTLNPAPYTGIQYVGIAEFQGIGTQVGQTMAGVLAGQMSVDQALKSAQSVVSRTMRQAGYPK